MESIMMGVFCLSPGDHNHCFAQLLIKQGYICVTDYQTADNSRQELLDITGII